MAEGTATFEDAEIEASTSGFPETDDMDQIYPGGADGDVASAAIQANELVVKNSVVNARCGSVAYKDGTHPKSIAIDAVDMSVSGSEIRATGGESYDSFGIRCTGNATLVGSEVEANGGAAKNMSIGFEAIDAFAVGVYGNSYVELNGGTSDYISIGGDMNIIDISDSTVYAYGGKAKRHSAGLVGVGLLADGSDVKGYGGVATDTDVIETEQGKEGVFSEGISFVTIDAADSEVYGEGEKAMVSLGPGWLEPETEDNGCIFVFFSCSVKKK